jgi:hypothetical protein
VWSPVTTLKNGAELKSLTSRENILSISTMKSSFPLLVSTIGSVLLIWSCQTNLTPVDPIPNLHSAARAGSKVLIEHKGKVISVSENAVAAHLAHGDNLVADFVTFHIRNNNSVPLPDRISAPWDSDIILTENATGDGFSFLTPEGGQKVGYGTTAFDGLPINQLNTVNWDKVSGLPNPGIVPYLNIWVTDGTNYAVIASEFVNDSYQGTDFGTRHVWKVFEYATSTGLNWLFNDGAGARDPSQFLTRNGIRVSLSDFSDNIKIQSPTVPYPSYAGSGAPRGGYGLNLIWGDTQSNFVGGTSQPHQINNLAVTAQSQPYKSMNP